MLRHFLLSHTVVLSAAIAFTIFCTILYCIPGNSLPKVDSFQDIDKLVHALLFWGLALLWMLEARLRRAPSGIAPIALALAVYGAAIELVQAFWIPSRSGDPLDWLVDLLGIGLAILSFRWLRRRLPGRA